MMDEREDRLDEMIRDTARHYNEPPATPRAEMWAVIRATRAASPAGRTPRESRRFPSTPLRLVFGMAALLALGIAIGRLTVPARPLEPAASTMAAQPGTASPAAEQRERAEVATRFATDDHLTQVEAFLTEFGARPATPEFTAQAQDLLTNTRLLLDSKRVADPRTRKLLEDLELVLVQIATLSPTDRRTELDIIADGLAQNHLRTRLRNAIPAGPAIRL